MTPDSIARFMASMFDDSWHGPAALLDAGAGVGTLSAAFIDQWRSGKLDAKSVSVTAYEIDDDLAQVLAETLAHCAVGADDLIIRMKPVDFIEDGLNQLQFGGGPCYTHAILNPPYAKITTRSRTRKLLRCAGIETVNLYAGFVAMALALLKPGGQLVAITPRSFCNGAYYRPFRRFLLERAAIAHIHLFGSRKSAFRDDDVLQENIIFRLCRDAEQGDVVVTTSTDASMSDYRRETYPFRRIVRPGDDDLFIHVPTSVEKDPISQSGALSSSLQDVGVQVSTGPVVDFRVRDHLRHEPESDCVPLLYPMHIDHQSITWPKPRSKKPNALCSGPAVAKMVFPAGHYVLVRRFSSKEERRRIVAAVVAPPMVAGNKVAIENHLNVFHRDKQSLDPSIAYGLMVYLNSTPVDQLFRTFSGHTQVNVTDLRRLPYPTRSQLIELGRWALDRVPLSQQEIDDQVTGLL